VPGDVGEGDHGLSKNITPNWLITTSNRPPPT
jgi:hypothetical protein